MAFKFESGDGSVAAALRRLALEQIDGALGHLADPGVGDVEKIHAARRRCKKLRGLVRLVRPGFPDYRVENAAIRDAAAALSQARDAEVLVQTYDGLVGSAGETADLSREVLLRRRDRAERERDPAAVLHDFGKDLAAIRERAQAWHLEAEGFAAIGPGFADTYRLARRAMARARKTHQAEHFHEWRKQVKYFGFQAALLRDADPELLKPMRKKAEHLAELLGEHHDLAVLESTMAPDPSAFGSDGDIGLLVGRARERQAGRAAEALALGAELFGAKPRDLLRRLEAAWQAWRRPMAAE